MNSPRLLEKEVAENTVTGMNPFHWLLVSGLQAPTSPEHNRFKGDSVLTSFHVRLLVKIQDAFNKQGMHLHHYYSISQ